MTYKDMTLTPEHRRLDYSYSSTRDYPDDLSDLSDELGGSDMEVVFVACAVAALVCMLLVIVFACCAVSASCAHLLVTRTQTRTVLLFADHEEQGESASQQELAPARVQTGSRWKQQQARSGGGQGSSVTLATNPLRFAFP